MKVLLAAIVLVLTGCSQTNNTPPPDTDSVHISRADIYVMAVREEYPELDDVDDKTLIKFGKSVCGLFDVGGTLMEAVETATNYGMPAEVAAYMAGAAVGSLCPRNGDKI